MRRISESRWLARASTVALASALTALGASAAAAPTLRTVTLPENLGFSGFAATRSGVSVTGEIQTGGGIAGNCDFAPLRTDPLGVGETTLRSCADPTLWGEPVAAVETVVPPSYNQDLHAARTVEGVVQLGPVLATYQADSGSHPVSAYGARSLWIYEEQGPGGPTIFRVSLATGALKVALRAPELTRPLLVADDDGAWLIPAGSYGAVSNVALYHIAPGSHVVVPALTLPGYRGGYATWAVATGHAVYADFCRRPVGSSACELFGLSGPSARPVVHRPSPADLVGWSYALAGPDGVYVLEQTKVLSTSSPTLYDWLVERVDPSTGRSSTVATIALPRFWNGPNGTGQPDAIIADGALYLLADPGGGLSPILEQLRW